MNQVKLNASVNKIKAYLKSIEAEEGLKFELSNGIGNSFGFEFKVTAIESDKVSKIRDNNKELSLRYGFTQNIVGMTFEQSIPDKRTGLKQSYSVTGFKPQNRTYPILAMRIPGGQGYKFSAAQVKRYLGGDKKINRDANLEKLFNEK